MSLAAGILDNTIRLWDMSKPATPPVVLKGHEGAVISVAFSPDGTHLASGSNDKTIRLWDLGKLGTPPAVLKGHEDHVLSVVFSPDGRYLASGSGQALTVPRKGHRTNRAFMIGSWSGMAYG
jgi:WD40 repeat protein